MTNIELFITIVAWVFLAFEAFGALMDHLYGPNDGPACLDIVIIFFCLVWLIIVYI